MYVIMVVRGADGARAHYGPFLTYKEACEWCLANICEAPDITPDITSIVLPLFSTDAATRDRQIDEAMAFGRRIARA